ncbi:MAG: hypothetical protein M1272_00830 [Firmicutes bacterium]|nr:hypothetical protein [Bacillota bacterium]
MPRAWAWFHNPSTVLSLVNQLGDDTQVSVLMQDPDQQDVVVLGPISRDMACYPFLDVCRQMRRFGVRRTLAEHYARVLRRGGAVICLETPDITTMRVLDELNAKDVFSLSGVGGR